MPRRLDRLLELREPGGITWLEWLRTPAAGSSPAEILTALEKLEYLRLLGGERVDLSMLPPSRVRMLAVEGRRRAAWEISRLPAARRHPLLLVFVAQMFVERGDELIDRYCTAIQTVERTATQAVKDQREATARQRDERSQLAGVLSQILLDAIDHGEDPVARARAEIGEQRLRACVEDPEALSIPIDVAAPGCEASPPRAPGPLCPGGARRAGSARRAGLRATARGDPLLGRASRRAASPGRAPVGAAGRLA